MPGIDVGIWQTYGPQGLVVVGIDPDADDYLLLAEVEAFCSTLGVTFPVGIEESDSYGALTDAFEGVNPYPVDVLVDKMGIIRYVAREYDPVAVAAMIEVLLAE